MTRYALLLLFAGLIQTPFAAHAGQNVAGLGIDYPQAFRPTPAETQKYLASLPENIRAVVKSFETFDAPPANGMMEVSLIKVRYAMEITLNIDGAASQTAQNVSRLEGMQNFKQSTRTLTVSGKEARLTEIEADRFGGKLGGEILIIIDRRTNTMWQLQFLFGKQKGLNPLATLNLDAERKAAKSMAGSVTVQQ